MSESWKLLKIWLEWVDRDPRYKRGRFGNLGGERSCAWVILVASVPVALLVQAVVLYRR